ncbi:hypothetical protein [Opitutus terrae]|nr:hypothetical protein [Opitutus terrae]
MLKKTLVVFLVAVISASFADDAPLAPILLRPGPVAYTPATGERIVMWAVWAESRDWTVTGVPDYIYPCVFDVKIDGESYTLTVGPFEGSERGATTADYGTNAFTFPSGSGVPVWSDSRGNSGIVAFANNSATPGLAFDYTFAAGMSRTDGVDERPNTRLRFYWPDDNVKLDGVVQRISADGKQVLSAGAYHGHRFGVGGGLSEYARVTWFKGGQRIIRHDRFAGESPDWFDIPSYGSTDAGTYRMHVENSFGLFDVTFEIGTATPTGPRIRPDVQSAAFGSSVNLFVVGSTGSVQNVQWSKNGDPANALSGASPMLAPLQPTHAGIYTATVNGAEASTNAAIVGITTAARMVGDGKIVGTDITHPNGNVFDQVLVTGPAEAVTAGYAPKKITRTSFIDLDNDIVQVEFSGPGTLTLVFDGYTPPALPTNYQQDTLYVKGHAGIVVTGADENTNVSVFTVGRATAFDPTGAYNILIAPSPTNNPANNGSSLFKGHSATKYDGVADLAFIAIASSNGKFGGIRTANANYFASKGMTGVYAPGVEFTGPIFIGNITAFDAANPVIILGSAADTRITGGDLAQPNAQPVQVSGISQLKFSDGSDSGGNLIPAKANNAVLMNGTANVTGQIVVNP